MKKTLFFLLCIAFTACNGNQNKTAQNQADTTQLAQDTVKKHTFEEKTLTYPDSPISFKVSTQDDSLLCIQAEGLPYSKQPFYNDIVGCTVTGAEVTDLNADGYPELLVYLTSDGSGSYGKLIGYSVNAGKSASQLYLPEIADQPNVRDGYMGHDSMYVKDKTFYLTFPIYKKDDTNANPTGGTRLVQYKLVNTNDCRALQVVKVTDK